MSPERPRIAIIDDDTSHRRALARLLRARGMEPLSFTSAEDYLASRDGGRVDCVLVDLELGGMSGFDLQARLAAERRSPPVVFMTAHLEPEILAHARQTGCACVRKIDPAEKLLAAIRRALRS